MSKKKKAYYSGIGGQAVLEGIMMRNKNKYSIVVRKSDGTMETVVKDVTGNPDGIIKKIPFVRGIFAFVESLKLGTEALEYSAEFYGTDTTEPTGFDKFLNKLFGKHTDAIVSAFTMILSLVICLGFFIALPFVASIILEKYIVNTSVISVIEGLIRIFLFVLYAFIMSFVKDTRRTFMYHGAEHKCINCIEHGKKLTVDNVRESSKLHGRCGTNFIFIIAIVTIVVFVFFFKVESVPLRLLLRIVVIPVIAGVSYEVLWLIGRFNNVFTDILAAPGKALQFITTREPDDEMIIVAINAVEAVFDWKSFLLEKFPDDVLPEDLGLEVKEEDKVKLSPKKAVKTNGKVKKKKKDVKAVIEPEEKKKQKNKIVKEENIDIIKEDKNEELMIDDSFEAEDKVKENDSFNDAVERLISDDIKLQAILDDDIDVPEISYNDTFVTDEYEEDLYEGTLYDSNEDILSDDGNADIDINDEVIQAEDYEASNDSSKVSDETSFEEEEYYENVISDEEVADEAEDTEELREESLDEFNEETEELQEEIGEEIEEFTDDFEEEIMSEAEEETYEEEFTDEVSEEAFDEALEEDTEELIEEVEEEYAKEDNEEEYDDIYEEEPIVSHIEAGLSTQKTQPIKLDFSDDYGFDPDDEEVPMTTMSFEPVDESVTGEIDLDGYYNDSEEYDGPKFNKNIVSIPMPEKINIVEVIPEGGMTSRIYNYNEEETDTFDDDEEEDYENIFDERGRLNIKDTDAFSKKIDDEFDALFKSLGLDSDDL